MARSTALESLAEQRVVVVDAAPALTVEAVGDVELRPGVALGRIGPRERRARLDECLPAKEGQPVAQKPVVDTVGADLRGEAAR